MGNFQEEPCSLKDEAMQHNEVAFALFVGQGLTDKEGFTYKPTSFTS